MKARNGFGVEVFTLENHFFSLKNCDGSDHPWEKAEGKMGQKYITYNCIELPAVYDYLWEMVQGFDLFQAFFFDDRRMLQL